MGRIILEGKIKLLSPAIIGSGKDENSDVDVLRNSEGKTYIPATSFCGVLRHSIKIDKSLKEKLERFWGSSHNEEGFQKQSSIIVDDLLPDNDTMVVIRDGVKIDNKRGIAEDKKKFDYEVIEPNSTFNLKIEIPLDGNDDEFKKRMLATIIEFLKNEKIRIGAKTNNGFGRIQLSDYKLFIFDFKNKKDVLRWFKHDFSETSELNATPFEINQRDFTITADFIIRNSLIVRSYNYDPNKPDIEHIKSNGKPVLPGTSLKGSIRARAERIINTLGKNQSIIDELFGTVNENEGSAKKGRIIVYETIINGYSEEVQTRLKIDRFTGGAIEGALLETKPLFRTQESKNLRINIKITNYQDHEASLMLLVLKDLWTGDLPVGGEKAVGRGVFEGKKAIIYCNGNKIADFENTNQLNDEQKALVQSFVTSLVNHGR